MKSLESLFNSIGLLILRLGFGGLMLYGHGWDKLWNFREKSQVFPDPLGVSSYVSLSLAVGAEFFCAIFLMLGIMTRIVAVPLTITMLVAFFVVHANDDFNTKEKAALYLIAYLSIILCGGGRFSLDSLFWKLVRRKKQSPASE